MGFVKGQGKEEETLLTFSFLPSNSSSSDARPDVPFTEGTSVLQNAQSVIVCLCMCEVLHRIVHSPLFRSMRYR